MDTVLLLLQTLLLVVCLLSNTLHLITVSSLKRFHPAAIARILPSVFLIIITLTMVPLEVYTVNSQQGYNSYIYNLIADKLEFLQIAALLGLNLLAAITKLRSYRCKAPAAISITPKSVVIPAFVIVAISVAITGTLCLYRPLVQNRTELDTNDYFDLSVEVVCYAFEIIPTVAVYITIFIYASQYYKQSSKKVKSLGIKKKRTLQGKKFRSVTISVFIYTVTFFLSWIPLFTLKIIAIVSVLPSQQLESDKIILCLKLAMFATYPVAEGMLLKRSRKKIYLAFLKIASFFSPILSGIRIFLISSILRNTMQTKKKQYLQSEKQTVNVNEKNEFLYTDGTSNASNKEMLDINDKVSVKELQIGYRRQIQSLSNIKIRVPVNTQKDTELSSDFDISLDLLYGMAKVSRNQRGKHLQYDHMEISPLKDKQKGHSAATSPFD